MDKGVTCEHLNKLADVLDKDLWHSKETLACYDCGCPGPNLWICLQPNCYHVGCSEVKNDHSTIHQKNYPTHCVHMNVSTERIWCYLCEKEVHIRAATAHIALGPDTTSLDGSGFSSRVGSPGLVSAEEDIDPDDMDYDDDSRPRGLVGLQNMGNTCYMNAALQALSNTAPLTSYFLECSAYISILAGDKKPALSRAYQKLMKEMWSPKTRGYVVPNGILYGIRNVHPMFRGYQQHDTQEFLRCFMDQLHEELKEPVNDSAEEDRLISDADGDHQEPRNYTRRRAASSGASDAPFFSRNRRKSPAASSYSESRTDGYLRVHQDMASSKHRRSASFGGTQLAYNVFTQHQVNGPDNQRDRDMGSESELSGSSEADERYETCSSGASDTGESTTKPGPSYSGGGDSASSNIKYRSIVSDVFDGKLLSSVQCLICNRVSRRVETFQDLSLPIPSRDQVSALRHQQHPLPPSDHDSWLWWLVSWFRSWFYGPAVSLQDCLAAFFSADELKGDNMYSCSRCNKLRNGIKSVGAVRLPEVLCVHLKRFRHELMFSAKVAARVSFPIHHLDMSPYMHPECKSKISSYSLCAVISHAGTAGGGHYTCAARQRAGWFLYDDHAVTPLHHHHLPNMEAYVLFYRKVNPQMAALRQKAAEILQSSCLEQNDIKFYISKQWINKFNTWAEPGAIDNSDFACSHGGVRPDRAAQLHTLCALLPQPLWQMLHDKFGGGPAVSHIHECAVCARAARKLRTRRTLERNTFYRLHHAFQEQENPRCIYGISMRWFREWQAFVRNKAPRPPPPVDNEGILTKQEVDGKMVYVLKPGSDHAQISGELWRFFIETYGGGPEVKLKCPSTHQCTAQQTVFNQTRDSQTFTDTRMSSKQSESDKEDYCVTTDNIQRLQKNQSLQNLQHKQYNEEITIPPYNGEANGNYDSDEDMDRLDSIPNQVINQPITMPVENGIDSSDHDANDNPVNKQTDKTSEHPNDITVKKSKTGKVRKAKRSAFAYFNSFTD